MSDARSAAAPASQPQVVSTEGGTVTLEELASLKTKLTQIQQESAAKLDQAKSLSTLNDQRLTEIGGLLLDHRNGWDPDEPSKALLARAAELRTKIAGDASEIGELGSKQHSGLRGAYSKVHDWSETRKLTAERTTLEAQLTYVLRDIGQASAAADIESVRPIREQARSAQAQFQQLEADAERLNSDAKQIRDEVSRREEATREMGFDSLYAAAYLQTFGATAVASPLNLKRGEQAVLAVTARLARNQARTGWVGGSQGFSFPIGHTGIRYRVGRYAGHPVQQQVLATLDAGTFVVTNQRIAFIGRAKSTSAALSKVVNVQCYSDALAIFQEGRENADYYFVAQPKYVLFMLNWATQHTS